MVTPHDHLITTIHCKISIRGTDDVWKVKHLMCAVCGQDYWDNQGGRLQCPECLGQARRWIYPEFHEKLLGEIYYII